MPIFCPNKPGLLLLPPTERKELLVVILNLKNYCCWIKPLQLSTLSIDVISVIYDVDILFIFNFTAIKQNIKHFKYLSLSFSSILDFELILLPKESCRKKNIEKLLWWQNWFEGDRRNHQTWSDIKLEKKLCLSNRPCLKYFPFLDALEIFLSGVRNFPFFRVSCSRVYSSRRAIINHRK